jgi:hypothetical protein
MLHLSLEPALVERIAGEIGADGTELLDTLRTRDPQVERIGLSLKAELEAGGGLGGGLYASPWPTPWPSTCCANTPLSGGA